MARLTYANVIEEFELDFTSKELKSFVRKDGSNLEELYTALNTVDGFANVLNDSKPKKAPKLTYAGVIEELGLEELTEKDLRSLVRKNKTTLQEMYTLMKEDPYFQRQLDIYKIQRDSKAGVADKVIEKLFGPNTPLPENTTIPTTMTQDEFKKRKSQPYDGIRSLIMTEEQKTAYNNMLNEGNEKGTKAIQDLLNFIATGETSSLVKYDTDTNAIPKAHKNTLRISDIDIVLKNIEYSYLMSPDYKREIKAIEAHLKGMLNKDDLILTQRYRNLIHSLAKILTAYDKDSTDKAVTEFIESNMENGFDVSPKHQEMLDDLILLKYGDIGWYEYMATRYETTEQPYIGQYQSPSFSHGHYIIRKKITEGMKKEPVDLEKICNNHPGRFDIEEIRQFGTDFKASRQD